MVLNFASFLEENKYFEDAFRVYEKVCRLHLGQRLLVCSFVLEGGWLHVARGVYCRLEYALSWLGFM